MTSGPEVDQCTHCEDMLFHRGYVVDEHGKLAAVNVGPPAKVTSVLAVTVESQRDSLLPRTKIYQSLLDIFILGGLFLLKESKV